LDRYEGKLEVVDILNGKLKVENGKLTQAIEDSISVQ
jgi:hypothetical protein